MPEALPAGWDHSPIDRFLFARMVEKGLQPNSPADRRTLIRRLTFNLIGLPPTPQEVDAFLADPEPNAYEKVVDRLLASPHYGERWGRHWLDVVRFGESHGYEQNHLRDDAWPYRDYVIRSLNEDKPFSRMIIEQLAGDQLAPGDPQIGAATGFLVAGPHDTVGIDNIEGEMQKRANDLDDMVMATATSFLGLTVNCARCHDHKFDPIEQKDYYRMQSVFAGVRHDRRAWATKQQKENSEQQAAPLRRESEDAEATLDGLRKAAEKRVDAQRDAIVARYRPSVDGHGTEETFEPVQARYLRMNVEESTGRGSVVLDELEIWTSPSDSRNVALAKQGAAVSASSTRKDDANPDTYSPKLVIDGKFDQAWMSGGAAPHWVQIEWPKLETISRIFWSSDRLEAFGGTFGKPAPELYTVEVSLDGAEWNKIADSFDRLPTKQEKRGRLLLFAVFSPEEKRIWEAAEKRKTGAEAQLAKLPKLETAYLGKFEQPKEPSFVMRRGDPMSKGELIAPASPTTLAHLLDRFEMDQNTPEGERRLALARWIADDRNALAARVIVNRIWMHHFGNPFVATPSDFGINGGEPTHAELLDWLAARFVGKHGWRWKPLHKEIVMSAAYRQSSEHDDARAAVDGDARYLWRFPPRRLEAEAVRDAVLAVSGKLDPAMGGKGFRLYRYTVDNVATYYPIEEFDESTFRRSVYHQHARSVKPELLGQYDCPDTSLPAPKRVVTTSPLQALSLLNNRFVLQQARFFAERLEHEAEVEREGKASGQQKIVTRAYQLAFGRDPEAEELEESVHFISDHGLFLFCRALLNTNEFVYVM